MKITLCGSCRFENSWKFWNELLTLRGHLVYSVTVLPSDKGGNKNWYNEKQKRLLDLVHLKKIDDSDAILVITNNEQNPDRKNSDIKNRYIGQSTLNEIMYATLKGKYIIYDYEINLGRLINQKNLFILATGDDL